MKRRLKTWEAFEAEFKYTSGEWEEDGFNDVYIAYKNMHWSIIPDMRKMFGTEIEVYKIDDEDYTYTGNGWYWHESWFEPEYKEIEFLSMEEVKI